MDDSEIREPAASGTGEDEPAGSDDETLAVDRRPPGPRRGARSNDGVDSAGDAVDETVAVDRRPPGPRRRQPASAEETTDEPTAPSDTSEGSTVIAHRESRRRANAAPSPASGPLQPLDGTPPRIPDSDPSAVYRPRDADPVVVSRAPAPTHASQAPVDTAAADAHLRARARRRLVATVVAASVVVVIAAGAVVALLLLT